MSQRNSRALIPQPLPAQGAAVAELPPPLAVPNRNRAQLSTRRPNQVVNGKRDTFPRKCRGLDPSQGEPRLPADRTPSLTPVWLSVGSMLVHTEILVSLLRMTWRR